MRTFIAITLPENIKSILSNTQDELKQVGADVKWVKPENIHLTLKFLGEIEQELLEKIKGVLEEIAQKNMTFSAYLSKLGAFPKLRYPRVIWISLGHDQTIIDIAKDLETRMLKIGFPKESRAFTTHITLGRIRSGLKRNELIQKIEILNKNISGPQAEFRVTNLTLFKSTLTPQGPIYETLLNCPLKSL